MTLRLPFTVYRLPFILCAISAILLILSFPNFNLPFLAWIAFVPLFFAIQDKKPSQAFLFGYITGLIFFLGSIYWLVHVTLLGYILLCLYLALYFGLFTLFLRNTKYERRTTILIIPAFWVALEYIRTTFATGFGWSLLAYSQYKKLPVIQIVDITGAYGVSFLIMMVNVGLYQSIVNLRKRTNRLYAIRYTLYAIIIISLALGYGYFRLAQNPQGDTIKISVVQGNIPQHRKWDKNYENFIFDRYEILTKVASKEEPSLIIWPETAFPGYFGAEEKLTRRVENLAKEIQIPILFGAPLILNMHDAGRTTNSAILLDSRGEIVQQYDKLRLVPFGEYVPFEKYLGFVHNIAPAPIGDFSPGDEYIVFRVPCTVYRVPQRGYGKRLTVNGKRTFSVLICFEDIFPSLSRRFVREGAHFLVNITNDAWFKESSAPYQHSQASVFRAVENRVNVIRSANTGLSCFIDTKGKIISRVKNREGKDIFVDGFDTQTIQVKPCRSFYRVYGDIFAYACIVLSLSVFVIKKSPTT